MKFKLIKKKKTKQIKLQYKHLLTDTIELYMIYY